MYQVLNFKTRSNLPVQRKKHFAQMTEKEIDYLSNLLTEINYNKTKVSLHLKEKINSGVININVSEMLETLKNKEYSLVDFNITETKIGEDRRLLLRSKRINSVIFLQSGKEVELEANLCFVLSITSNVIVTAYWNRVNDTHNTLKQDKYDKDLQLI